MKGMPNVEFKVIWWANSPRSGGFPHGDNPIVAPSDRKAALDLVPWVSHQGERKRGHTSIIH